MSKVNVDEIKVGDLIGFDGYKDKLLLGYVNRIEEDKYWCYWSGSAKDIEQFLRYKDIDYHWKVINFEEEKRMDELKVYTGKSTIEALLEGKTLAHNNFSYKFTDDLKVDFKTGKGWESSQIKLNNLLGFEFTEVVTPQVGNWVRVTHSETKALISTGEITKIDEEGYWGEWNQPYGDIIYPIKLDKMILWEILSPEQVSEYKREQAFVKVGRKLNEFRHGDIVYIDALATVATVITKNNGMEEIKLHGINEAGKGYTARAHQLTPISFVENQVSLD